MSDGRYQTHPDEDFEPGSNETVLKNKLGIVSSELMDSIESEAFERCFEACLEKFHADDRITLDDIEWIHKLWLGEIYPFAGEYRSVNMSKGGFLFAAAHHLPKLMNEYQRDVLDKFTPGSQYQAIDDLARALAIIHVEFILIHPFREGNGRLGRLICMLIAFQAGADFIDFHVISTEPGRTKYIEAIHQGLDRNYDAMTGLFKSMLTD